MNLCQVNRCIRSSVCAVTHNIPWNLDKPEDVTAFCFFLSRKLLGKRKSGSDDRKISVPMIMNPNHQAPTNRGSLLSNVVGPDRAFTKQRKH